MDFFFDFVLVAVFLKFQQAESFLFYLKRMKIIYAEDKNSTADFSALLW